MSDFSTRPATLSDVSFLTDCAEAAYAQYVEAIGTKPAPMIFDFKAGMGDYTIDIIETGAEPAGYLVWQYGDDALYLESIAILPRHHGKGLASRAMEYLENRARENGAKAIRLYTNAKMESNLTLYPHMGFVRTDRRVEDGFDRVYFSKSID